MSFSVDTRVELARIVPEGPCCRKAQLAGIFLAENVGPPTDGDVIEVSVGHPAVARIVYTLMKSEAPGRSSSVERSRHKPPKRGYHVRTIGDGSALYRNVIDATLGRKGAIPESACCLRAFLRGVFLARGSVSSPAKAYHLEVNLDRKAAAAAVIEAMERLLVIGRLTVRREGYSVYIKESEGIVRLLGLMGAHQAVLEFENVRIVKEMRNQVNRLVNCETANVDKTVSASMRQIAAIRRLAEADEFGALPASLRQLAEARLEHPYASMRELGELLYPRISKSGVNYRMKQLMEWVGEKNATGGKQETVDPPKKNMG